MINVVLLAAAMACPVEHATYALRGTPQIAAHFERVPRTDEWPTGLVLAIRGRATGRTTYWLPWPGGTDGQQHIRRTALHNPAQDLAVERHREWRGDTDFFTTDRTYRFATQQPHQGSEAPAHLLIPNLDLWHAGEVNGARDASPRAFFVRTGCHRSTTGDRGPDVILPFVP